MYRQRRLVDVKRDNAVHPGERITQLYYEDPRWFVEEIVTDELASA